MLVLVLHILSCAYSHQSFYFFSNSEDLLVMDGVKSLGHAILAFLVQKTSLNAALRLFGVELLVAEVSLEVGMLCIRVVVCVVVR